MKILRYDKNGDPRYGVLGSDDTVRDIVGSPFGDFDLGAEAGNLADLKLLAPVEPDKIIGAGLNYKDHIIESGMKTPKFPMLFMKPSTAVIGPDAPIVYPSAPHVTDREDKEVEFEAELVVVIGREARHVSEADALDYVLGYCCGNDVSARGIQLAEMGMGALLVGKGFDSFCPLGPVIETDLDPADQQLKARVNGETKQDFSSSGLLFTVPELVSYLSSGIRLLPGDVIMTGTDAGVGPIHPGDVVEIETSGIGVLSNPVIAEE